MSAPSTVQMLPNASVARPATGLETFRAEIDYVLRTLRRLGVRSEDLEDLAHEVFLVLDKKWKGYDSTRPLRPYLFGIAFRVARTHARRLAREYPEGTPEIADPGPLPDHALDDGRARDLVLRALDRVPLARRAVIILHDIDGIPMREIASALSIPRFTAYSRLRKARVELADAVREISGGRTFE